jgi:glutamate 5-kinase
VVLLTDIEGLYTADPRVDAEAHLVEVVDSLTEEHLAEPGEQARRWAAAEWPPSSRRHARS